MGPEERPLPTSFGQYQLVRLIGAGGMARVFEARFSGPHGFEKRLAIKMMLPEHADDKDFVTMLIDEAKIAVALTHSNICQVHELGCIKDRYYIAMEYVEGADLNRVVNRSIQTRIPIPYDVIALIGQDICSGLDYAHTKSDDKGKPLNIIHRDISPANILISMSGEVKIVDFGVAKATSRSQQTSVGVVKGKYQYMSPEQVTGRKLDYRSDIFAAGIVLYETIAGRMMYPEGPDMLDRIRMAKIRDLRQIKPDIPRELEQIVLKALSRLPQDRFQSAGEMGEALAEFRLLYQTNHGRGRLDELMARLFGKEMAEIQRAQRQAALESAPKEPTSRHLPVSTERRNHSSRNETTDENRPQIPNPSPPENGARPVQRAPAPDSPANNSPEAVLVPNVNWLQSDAKRDKGSKEFRWNNEELENSTQSRGVSTEELDWDEDEVETKAQDPAQFEPSPAELSHAIPIKKPRNLENIVPNDDEIDHDEEDPTLAFDATLRDNSVEDQSTEQEPMRTIPEGPNPLFAHLQHRIAEASVESAPKRYSRESSLPPDDTVEVNTLYEDSEILVDIDLSLINAEKENLTAAYFLVRDPSGKTSGPYSRAQLHDMALEGVLNLTNQVAPTTGAGVPRTTWRSSWSPPALYVADSDTEYEAQMALQLPSPLKNHKILEEPAARLFLQIASKQLNGALIFDRPGVHKEVTFTRGHPTYSSSNIPEEQLGSRLVHLGLVSSESLAPALELALQKQQTLPEALVALKLIKKETLHSCIQRLIQSRLLELFRWTEGQATYHTGYFDAAPIDLFIEPLNLIKEGVQLVAGSEGAIGWLMKHKPTTLILTGDSRKPLEYLGIPKETLDFLDRLSDPMNVRELIEHIVAEGLNDEEIATAILFAFHAGYLAAVAE